MKKIMKCVVPTALAVSLAAMPSMAYAETFVPSPAARYSPEITAKLEDNVMEYGEIEMLIDTYNSSLKNLREQYRDNKDSMSDIDKVKDQIYDGADQLQDAAEQMSDAALSMESMLGYEIPMMGVSVLPSAYAELVFNAAVMENQAEQMLLSVDQLTEMTPEMMKIQMVDSPRAAMISGAQSLLIAYENLLIQKGTLMESIALAEAGVQTAERMAAAGMGTQSAVNSAKQGLSSAKAGLITLEANEVNLRQQLCTMLGWAYDASPEIPEIPAADMARVDAMNPEADIQTAVQNNWTLKYNRLSEETMKNGTVQKENLYRTMKAQEAEIAVSMTKLYNTVLQERNNFYNAQTALETERGNYAEAERRHSLGMLSNMELMQKKNAFVSAEAKVRTSELTLLQAIETYEWAVKGNLTLTQK